MTSRPAVATPELGVVTGEVVIGAPPAVVWDYVTDWERQREWIPATSVRVVGDEMIARTGIGPIGFDDVMHVVRSEPPHLCEVAHTGSVVSGTGVFTCTPADGGRTVFGWEERVRVPGGPIAGLLWRVAAPGIRLGYAVALTRLRRNLE
ncbi:SRPBCC family protein [Mumia zhuanghuii]|uniref:SRPBCC family protein n=2 Tax=Mumia TaxID=1546255 RepID=A0ABW1QMS2_9ACTN|nr:MULTISPECIES: SRPBCC family protein [Mumia]KAA1420657.1 SRPBCC family protein [Mumia zhuanghuii]